MQTIFAKTARLPGGWAENVRLTIEDLQIKVVSPQMQAQPGDTCVDALLPALANLHSHSFQRAMAGMTEFRRADEDSFWTWRDVMYRFTSLLTPDQIESIAALTFMEMQEAGFAAVGEFHYLHHQPDGTPYEALSELGDRIMSASQQTGIGLTHLPVLYTYGGAGQAPLQPGQGRFGNPVDRFADLLDASRTAARALPKDTRLGIAPHSLRAISPDDLARAIRLAGSGPIHLHIAEQPREVREIQSWLGARPVEWLLANAEVTPQWCLIHATHMTEQETAQMARSGAVAGLCPITEANLGDGPFKGPAYLASQGAFGVGSDSNVRISLGEELRTLEYSQRLRDLRRNVLTGTSGSVGETLYLGAAAGGAQALNRNAGHITVGALADLVAIDTDAPALCALPPNQLLDGVCFAAGNEVVTDLWSAGRHQVQGGHHIARDTIMTRYRRAMAQIMETVA